MSELAHFTLDVLIIASKPLGAILISVELLVCEILRYDVRTLIIQFCLIERAI